MSIEEIKPKSHSFNDIYILLSNNKILNVTKEDYDKPEKIIESVVYKKGDSEEEFKKNINRFFLNDEGVYPINLAGPAVTKVIPWNIKQAKDINAIHNALVSKKLEEDPNYFKPGYFIDLRQLQMSRLNMITIPDISHHGDNHHDHHDSATPIPPRYLVKTKNTFVPVPEDQRYQLSEIPEEVNLYIAFFDDQDKTHINTECYSYKVCYIPSSDIESYVVIENEGDKKDKEHIQHLKTYYGETGVQSGALNPYDILSKNDFELVTRGLFPDINMPICVGGGRSGDGSTCYVANLATFKKS